MVAILLLAASFVTRAFSEQPKQSPPAAPPAGKAAAAKPPPPVPLWKQEPFDLITLDASNNNAQLKVLPLLDGTRKAPFQVDLNGKYRVRLVGQDDREYEILGKNIAKVELFEELLLKEANRLAAEGQFDESFRYLYLLRTNHPELPGLDAAVASYLYQDAFQLTRNKRYAEALGVIEELYRRQPDFRRGDSSPLLPDFLNRLADRVVNSYVEKKDYRAARTLISRLGREYGANKPASVDEWSGKLAQMAAQKRDQARDHMKAERFREALAAAKEMADVWPDVAGGRELFAELAQQYPLITVGVVQPALESNAQRLDDWPARRTGRLVHRNLVEFLGPGPEGGQYELPLGLIEHSEDRPRLILRLNRSTDPASAPTGYQVGRRLLQLADPRSSDFSPAWAALVKSATVKDVLQVDVALRHPHVLPEALLRVPLAPAPTTAEALPSGTGPFAVVERNEVEVHFVRKGFRPGGRLAEIVERTYAESQRALAALRRGDVDVLDRLFPADALRLREGLARDANVQVSPYALPTVHMLVPNTAKNPFLAHRDFRRAIEYAIDRQNILQRELLGGREVPGCQVVSGPFPAGAVESDPLGYAYDRGIPPRRYDPRLAKLLSIVSQKQVAEMAAKRGDAAPKLSALVLGHPAHELARVACEAIASQLKPIGLTCTTKQLPPGAVQDAAGQCDLVYAEIAIWEPVVDAGRLFGPGGPAASDNAYVRQAIIRLEMAESWSEVRERLLELHGAVHNEAAVIPLWQIVDYYAYNKRVQNVGENLVWLYQNVDQWRLAAKPAE